MKEIVVLGKPYQYEIEIDYGDIGTYAETKFYDGFDIVTYKQFWLFGKEHKKAVPKFFLKVDYNIESEYFTKKELEKKLKKDFKRHIGLLNRQEEIEKGELI